MVIVDNISNHHQQFNIYHQHVNIYQQYNNQHLLKNISDKTAKAITITIYIYNTAPKFDPSSIVYHNRSQSHATSPAK